MAASAPGLEIPSHPQVRPDVEFLPPEEGERAWTLADERHSRFTRVGCGAAALLRSLDGTRDLIQVKNDLGPAVPERELDAALRKFTDLGLLQGTEAEPPKERRFRFRPPASLQFTLLGRPKFLAPGSLLPRVMASRAVAGGCLLAVVAGLMAAGLGAATIADAAWRPLPWHHWLIAFAIVVVVNGIHELAHGAVLARFGGRPHRIGVMLFYCAPAMFCDVTDLWRLRTRRQRVLVALAGVICQLAAAGLLTIASWLCGGQTGRVLGLSALMTALTGVLNLLPFIRLDGYIALMAWVNIPNLRDKSMADCRAVVGWAVFGGPRPTRLLPDGWAVFGAACILYPWIIIGNLLAVARGALMAYGPMGALSWLCLLTGVVGYLLYRLLGLYRSTHARNPLRGLAVLTAAATGLIVLAQSQPYTQKTYGAYTRSGARTDVFFPEAPGVLRPSPGGEVVLMTTGALGNRRVGTAVTGPKAAPEKARLELFLPLKGVPGEVVANRYGLESVVVRNGVPDRGVVVADAGSTTWLSHLTATMVGEPWRSATEWIR
ncbi:daptide biosynthesis intramembrane metalloprotease [Streptomyces sp. NPDC006660]|uniref:daptide biosynthesis intramembrane metalloprotease n=1 Tax=Streptomyces sp. NPDC006660 TaxID=3156901 RepID=UPI0033C2EA18